MCTDAQVNPFQCPGISDDAVDDYLRRNRRVGGCAQHACRHIGDVHRPVRELQDLDIEQGVGAIVDTCAEVGPIGAHSSWVATAIDVIDGPETAGCALADVVVVTWTAVFSDVHVGALGPSFDGPDDRDHARIKVASEYLSCERSHGVFALHATSAIGSFELCVQPAITVNDVIACTPFDQVASLATQDDVSGGE